MMTFDEHAVLTKDQIQKAAALTVIAQNGIRVPFGDLFKDRKTIVVFIRHVWCVKHSLITWRHLTSLSAGVRCAKIICTQSRVTLTLRR